MPSVDRVGRYFPLTITLPLEAQPGALAAAISAHAWFAGLEEVALRALESDASPDELDAGLAEAAFPWAPGDGSPAAALAEWWRTTPTAEFAAELPEDLTRLDDLVLAAAESVFATAGRGRSLWWSLGTGSTRLRCFAGLPPPERFADLLRGSGW
jgi:type VI secretion system protein ImpM